MFVDDGRYLVDAENKCLGLGVKTPAYMKAVQPGGLLQLISGPALPPAQPPLPELVDSDVNEPPLPAVSLKAPSPSPGATTPPAPAPKGNDQPKHYSISLFIWVLPVLASVFLLLF